MARRITRRTTAALIAAAPLILTFGGGPASATAPMATSSAGDYVLTAHSFSGSYAPTYTGNGYLAIRVPAAGQGYAAGTVPAQAELAGFYAQPPGDVQQRANLPTWSTLTFSDGAATFAPGTGTLSNWRQTLDLHTGVITTSALWTAPNGHRTSLRYDVFTDRARPHVAAVRLQLTPQWTGTAAVTDLIDGTPATLTTGVAAGRNAAGKAIWESVRTAAPASPPRWRAGCRSPAPRPGWTPSPIPAPQSIGQRAGLPVTAGRTYTVTKYIGVTSSQDAAKPTEAALQAANAATASGYSALLAENTSAWSQLWSGRVDVLGNPTLATEVNASQFYLWSSTRAGVNWSISPAGLSSNGYDGHIFWDAETWMYPTLLAQHPELAAGMNNYRFERLGAAQQHAQATGYAGARFPWESALDGTEQIPPPVSVNSEGLYEQHITADIALAQWQYYLATATAAGSRHEAGRCISQAATFWASRVTAGRERSLPHQWRHRAGRGEPGRQRRGVHQRRRGDDAARRDAGRAGPRPVGTRVVAADRRGARRSGRSGDADAPRVRRLPGPAGQAGRRHDAAVPVAAADAGDGGAARPRLLRAAQRPGRPVDGRRDQPDRHRGARHSRLRVLRLHPAQHRAVHA